MIRSLGFDKNKLRNQSISKMYSRIINKDPSAWLEDYKTKSSPPGAKFPFVTSQSKFPQQPATSFRPLTSMPEQSLASPFGSTGNLENLKATTKDQKNTNLVLRHQILNFQQLSFLLLAFPLINQRRVCSVKVWKGQVVLMMVR